MALIIKYIATVDVATGVVESVGTAPGADLPEQGIVEGSSPAKEIVSLVWNTAQFAPGGQNSQQAAVDMGRVSACMPADFFEIDRPNRPGEPVDLG